VEIVRPTTGRGALSQVALPIEEATTEYARYLFYGPMGVGKTYLAGTARGFEAFEPILFCDVDMGTKSIGVKGYDRVPVARFETLRHVIRWLRANPDAYKLLFVDGLTTGYNLGLIELVSGSDLNLPTPTLQNWGHGTHVIRQLLRALQKLPIHVVCTAKEGVDADKITDVLYTGPSMPGKMAREVGGYFDLVGRMSVRVLPNNTSERTMRIQPTGRIRAKNRSLHAAMMGSVLKNVNLPELYMMDMFGEVPKAPKIEKPNIIPGGK